MTESSRVYTPCNGYQSYIIIVYNCEVIRTKSTLSNESPLTIILVGYCSVTLLDTGWEHINNRDLRDQQTVVYATVPLVCRKWVRMKELLRLKPWRFSLPLIDNGVSVGLCDVEFLEVDLKFHSFRIRLKTEQELFRLRRPVFQKSFLSS